jgi:hypothetical protein
MSECEDEEFKTSVEGSTASLYPLGQVVVGVLHGARVLGHPH